MIRKFLFIAVLVIFGNIASADEYEKWLAGQNRTVKTSPPLFSDEEVSALPDQYGFDYKFVNLNGIMTPTVNGRFLIGVSYCYTAPALEQIEYDSKILASAGVNFMRAGHRSPADEGGDPPTIKNVRSKQETFFKRGIACIQDISGITYIMESLADLYTNVLKKPVPEGYAKWYNGLEGTNRYGDFFNADYRKGHGQVLADFMKSMGPSASVGYIYSDEPHLGGLEPKSSAATKDWQDFVKRFYNDQTPAKDTNGDGATFNSVFKKTYAAWDEVKPFPNNESDADNAKKRLKSMWIRYAHARFIDTLSEECQTVRPDATVSEAYNDEGIVSLINAMPHNKFLGFGNYGRIPRTVYFTSTCHAYDKPGLMFHLNWYKGNYYNARFAGVASLPFTAGQIWWPLHVGCSDITDADYGSKYSLADWWEYNSERPIDWKGSKLNRIVEYDSRFLVISQIAPFMGKFDSMPAEMQNSVLWIDPPSTDLVRNNHTVAEEALVLGHQKINLDRYKLVMFMKDGPADFAETYEILRDYVKRGGTVMVNINQVGSGATLFGQANSKKWLADYKPGRASPAKLGTTIYEDPFNNNAQWRKDRFSHEGDSLYNDWFLNMIGPNDKWGSFVYKFSIPEACTDFRISDRHTNERGEIRMWISNDNKSWKLQHEDRSRSGIYKFSKLFSVEKDLDAKHDLYVKYYFKVGPGNNPGDIRGNNLSYFKLEGFAGKDAQMMQEWNSEVVTTAKFAGTTLKQDKMDVYVLGGKGSKSLGEITDSKGSKRPLVIERKEGKGRWLAWNYPAAVNNIDHSSGDFRHEVWDPQWKLLDAVVRGCTEGRIEDYNAPYIAQGDGCLTASTWDMSIVSPDYQVTFKSAAPKTVVYAVLDEIAEGGPYIETKKGVGKFTKDLSNTQAPGHIWVLKPYGKPILLCADGTVKHVMKIDDGEYEAGVLTFTMAQKASISSPSSPKSITHNGQKVDFTFDKNNKIIHVKGTGKLGECKISFEI